MSEAIHPAAVEIIALVATLDADEVDLTLADLRAYPDPRHPAEEEAIRAACMRRLEELAKGEQVR